MASIEHTLKFVTELDETNYVARQLLALPQSTQILMLESMLKELVGSRLQPILDELNEHNSYATLKLLA